MSFTDPSTEGYLELELTTDVESLTQIGIEYMEAQIPGWTARPGNVETIMIESTGQIAGELVDQASQVPPEAFAYLGTSIFNFPKQEGTAAIADATMTFAVDVEAMVIPLNTQVAVPHPSGDSILFMTDRDVTAPAGGGVVSLALLAAEPGFIANGAYGPGELVDMLDGLTSIDVLPAVGGTDPETDAEYLDRLSLLLTTYSDRPILPRDHIVIGSQVPGVGRITVIDLYQPGTNDNKPPLVVEGAPVLSGAGANNVPRCCSVCITAEDGANPSQALMHEVWLHLDAAREVNFLEYVIPPNYISIDLRATVVPYPGIDPATAAEVADAMVREWLSPGGWGLGPYAGSGASYAWSRDTVVRLYEAVDYLNRAGGVWFCKNVEMKKTADSTWLAADIALTGMAPLPQAGTITITGEAPPA